MLCLCVCETKTRFQASSITVFLIIMRQYWQFYIIWLATEFSVSACLCLLTLSYRHEQPCLAFHVGAESSSLASHACRANSKHSLDYLLLDACVYDNLRKKRYSLDIYIHSKIIYLCIFVSQFSSNSLV